MNITLLHNPMSFASRDFLASLGIPIPEADDVTVAIGLDTVRIVSDHAAAVELCPAFPGYPVALVEADGVQYQLAFPADWADVTSWASNPAPAVSKPTVLSKYDFSQRMQPAERIAIREAGKTDAQVDDFLDLLSLAEQIDLADVNVIGGLALLVSKGLLTEARKTEILVP